MSPPIINRTVRVLQGYFTADKANKTELLKQGSLHVASRGETRVIVVTAPSITDASQVRFHDPELAAIVAGQELAKEEGLDVTIVSVDLPILNDSVGVGEPLSYTGLLVKEDRTEYLVGLSLPWAGSLGLHPYVRASQFPLLAGAGRSGGFGIMAAMEHLYWDISAQAKNIVTRPIMVKGLDRGALTIVELGFAMVKQGNQDLLAVGLLGRMVELNKGKTGLNLLWRAQLFLFVPINELAEVAETVSLMQGRLEDSVRILGQQVATHYDDGEIYHSGQELKWETLSLLQESLPAVFNFLGRLSRRSFVTPQEN